MKYVTYSRLHNEYRGKMANWKQYESLCRRRNWEAAKAAGWGLASYGVLNVGTYWTLGAFGLGYASCLFDQTSEKKVVYRRLDRVMVGSAAIGLVFVAGMGWCGYRGYLAGRSAWRLHKEANSLLR